MTAEDAVIEEADRLADLVELEDIIYFETSIKRQEPEGLDVPADSEFPIQVSIGQSEALERLLVRVTAEVSSPQATFRVDVGAQFVLAEPMEATPDARLAFANHTAMSILMPYLRESMMTMASRMRIPPPMLPLVQVRRLIPDSVTITD